METLLAFVVGFMVTASVYLMLSRNLIKFIIGMTLIGNAANLLIFTCGGLTRSLPPLVREGAKAPPPGVANPLPQALVLTAIVISFGLLAFALTLAYRAYQELGTVNTDEMRVAEPLGGLFVAASPVESSDPEPHSQVKPDSALEESAESDENLELEETHG